MGADIALAVRPYRACFVFFWLKCLKFCIDDATGSSFIPQLSNRNEMCITVIIKMLLWNNYDGRSAVNIYLAYIEIYELEISHYSIPGAMTDALWLLLLNRIAVRRSQSRH